MKRKIVQIIGGSASTAYALKDSKALWSKYLCENYQALKAGFPSRYLFDTVPINFLLKGLPTLILVLQIKIFEFVSGAVSNLYLSLDKPICSLVLHPTNDLNNLFLLMPHSMHVLSWRRRELR